MSILNLLRIHGYDAVAHARPDGTVLFQVHPDDAERWFRGIPAGFPLWFLPTLPALPRGSNTEQL